MSSCLIITQGNKMYIGADTACSVKTKDGYKRISNDMPKLFTLGNSVFFCSGKKADAERCVNWIFDNFERSIDFDKLGIYLRDNFNIVNEDNIFNIEFLLCDYDNHNVIQLSQYNNFEPVIYDYAEQVRIICGGYKTNDSFIMAKKNIALNESVFNIYKNVFEAISDECVGGNMIIYNSPTNYETYRLEEKNISYCNINENNLFLLTSDFVTSGVINGSQIIGGDIYSTNYSSTEGSHINLLDGSFTMGGGALSYDKTNGLRVQGNGTFTGIIHAKKGGTIGGWSIGDTTITGGNIVLNSNGTINNTNGKWSLNNDGSASFSNVSINGGGININNRFVVNANGDVTLPDNAKITWGQVTGTGDIATKSYVTGQGYQTADSIKSTVITKDYIETLNIRAGSVAAENITGTTITGKTISGGQLSIGNGKFSVNNQGILSATGATISGTLTAGSGSFIGNSGSGWEIIDNQIRSVGKIQSTGGLCPILTLSTGTTIDSTYILAPDCFQLGGWQDTNCTQRLGARFIGNVEIHGNCNITGIATASNLSVTGGKIGDWGIKTIASTGQRYLYGEGGLNDIGLYPGGTSYSINGKTYTCYFVVFSTISGNAPFVAITNQGVVVNDALTS